MISHVRFRRRPGHQRGRQALVRLCLLAFFLVECHLPGSTRPLVKIGLLAPFEGLHRPLGYDVLYAVKLAIRERNADGGVSGWGVELVALDDGQEAEEARRAAEKVTVDAGVVGVIGPFSAATVQAAAPVLTESALPWITLAPVTDEMLQASRPYAFRLFASYDALADAAARYIARRARRPGVVRAGDDVLADALAAALKRQGSDLALDARWDASSWVGIEAVGPDALFIAGGAEAAADLLTGMSARGLRSLVVAGPEAGEEIITQRAGIHAEGTVWVSSISAARVPTLPASFVEGYRDLAGKPPGPYALLAYDATQALLDALAADIRYDGRPSRRGTAEALSVVRRDGLNGRIAFGEGGGWSDAPVYLYRISRGNLYTTP